MDRSIERCPTRRALRSGRPTCHRAQRRLALESLEDRRLLTTIRLDDPGALTGDVQEYQLSPDQQFAVYLADDQVDKRDELYSVELATGEIRRLNDTLVAGGDVLDFQISADNGSVVYRADQETDEVVELYSVPMTGGGSTKLNAELVDGGDVTIASAVRVPIFEISADSSRVVYLADQEADEVFQLYSVPLAGGDVTRLSRNLPDPDRDISVQPGFQISPDSSRVVFRADQDTEGVIELYVVPIAGTDSTKLNANLIGGGNVAGRSASTDVFQITADSSRVIYVADQETNETFELFSVPLAGGLVTKLNDELTDGGNVDFQFELSNGTVVYRADQEVDGTFELFRASTTSTGSTKLNNALISGGDVMADYQISPNGNRVVYRADQLTNNTRELFSVPLTGGGAIRLNDPLVEGGNVSSSVLTDNAFRISPDSMQVVYLADQDTDELIELYSVPIGGGASVKLNGELLGGDEVLNNFMISPDSTRVVYMADQQIADRFELYGVPMVGGLVTKLNGPLTLGGDVEDAQISANSVAGTVRVFYRASENQRGVTELYSAGIASGGSNRHSGPLISLGDDVFNAALSPNGRFAVFRADQDVDDVLELYSVNIVTGVVTKLNDPLVVGGDVQADFQISPDSTQVVYRATQDTAGVNELFSVPIVGGDPVKLNAEFVDDIGMPVADRDVFEFQISGDSRIVVYRADQELDGTDELYKVPLGGGDLVKLNGTMDSGGDVRSYLISPDSRRAVYRADQDTDQTFELYSVPLDVDDPLVLEATKLNRALVPGGDVLDAFAITSNSDRVVYQADQDTNNLVELYNVPLEGGPATKLNAPLVPGGDVSDFLISPDDNSIVYRADQETNNRLELFSTPITGPPPGVGPTKLNAALIDDGNVQADYQISMDSSTVVYRADQELDQMVELYSVPLAGGEVVKLNGLLEEEGDVQSEFQLSEDGNWVVYRADQDTDDVEELYRTAIAGGSTNKLNGVLTTGGDVAADFQISPDNEWVVYLADQDTDDVVELYAVLLDPTTPTDVTSRLNDPLVAAGDVISRGPGGFLISEDSVRVVYFADQDIDDQIGLYETPLGDGEPPPLTVTDLVPNLSGFVVEFSGELDLSVLNLYDTPATTLGPADVIVEGATSGEVRGSFVVDPSLTKATFAKTGDPMPPDIYTVRLRGGPGGFRSAAGAALEGNSDGTPGDDYEDTFQLAHPDDGRTVGVPDFVRGPGQDVNLSVADGTAGIPVSISEGQDVRIVVFTIDFDTTLLIIDEVTVGPQTPDGSTVVVSTESSGTTEALTVTFRSPTGLPAGEQAFVHLVARVPANNASANFRRQQVLDVHDIAIRAGVDNTTIQPIDNDGVHLVTYFGDVTANGRINAGDASRIARFAALLDGGFAPTLLTDPIMIGDISGNGRINARDASLLASFAALDDVPEIPPIPAGVLLAGGVAEAAQVERVGAPRRPLAGTMASVATGRFTGIDLIPGNPVDHAAVDHAFSALEERKRTDHEEPMPVSLEDSISELFR